MVDCERSLPDLYPIPNYDGYWASEDGRIFSSRYRRRYGETDAFPRELASSPDRDGYLKVTVRNSRNRTVGVTIHILMALTFCGPKPELNSLSRHLDDVKTNNSRENIAWGTATQNAADRTRNRRTAEGANCKWATLTEGEVREIMRLRREDRLTFEELAKRFRVSPSAIRGIVSGESWKNLDLGPREAGANNRVGDLSPQSVLSGTQVMKLRRRKRMGATDAQLAEEFGCSVFSASAAACGDTWSHIPGAVPRAGARGGVGEGRAGSKLTESDVREIRRRKAAGETERAIATDYGIGPSTVGTIHRRLAWAHVTEEE